MLTVKINIIKSTVIMFYLNFQFLQVLETSRKIIMIHLVSLGKLVLLLIIILAILYFSWIPDSHLISESYLPLWLRGWSNEYFNLRTAVPFVAFGFLLGSCNLKKSTFKKRKFKFSVWCRHSIAALVVVCLAEVGQFFVLNRHPDLMDVLFGILGSQFGFLLYHIFANQLHRFYSKR
jgi:glycopeptide antibiotics resistance protein